MSTTSFRRPVAWIDLEAIRHNARIARRQAGSRQIFAAVKADGYGHGMFPVAEALRGLVDGYMVATVGEGLALRKSGVTARVMVLQGFMDRQEARQAARGLLEPVIHDPEQVDVLRSGNTGLPTRAWFKLDTGMHRLGMSPEILAASMTRLADCRWLRAGPGLMTHLACADEPGNALTAHQLKVFHEFCSQDQFGFSETSIANSAALLGEACVGGEVVRPGIMLYGANPFVCGSAADHGLKPAMRLTSQLIAIKTVPRGGSIGYGATFRCTEDMRIGVAAIGYGDGYPRHAPTGTPVSVNGQRAALVGRVSMDLVTLNLSGVDARVGDEVEFWGPAISADEVAGHCGTIAYELFCGLSGRVARQYRGLSADTEPPGAAGQGPGD
ncbi:MAG: alanine racemase [Halothiobacillaceae bacterium]